MLEQHKKNVLNNFNDFLERLISSNDPHAQGRADKLLYWMDDWMAFLDFESSFSPSSLRRYKRGEIVKVHLGFNVGSEEGGLHYAVVLDKNNSLNSPVLTIVPLTSVKSREDLSKLHKSSVFLGNELFTNLSSKISSLNRAISENIAEIQKSVPGLETISHVSGGELQPAFEMFKRLEQQQELLQRTRKEISRMKSGSIALVGQVRTISKIRIYDPKTNFDVLSGVKLSNENLDQIDRKLQLLYTNNE